VNRIDAAAAAVSPDLRPVAAFPAALAQTPVAAGPAALLSTLRAHFPGHEFREVARRGGWHRPGGVIDRRGRRLAEHLEDWLAAELACCDDALETLAEKHGDDQLCATRLAGTTLYLVADTGPEADAFLQIEIEILQESLGTRLFGTPVDEDAAALIERCAAVAAGQPIGEPRYLFRRLLDIGTSIAALRSRAGVTPPTVRFLDDWTASSAHAATTLGRHWIMQVSEHLDRFRQMQVHVKPLSTTVPAQRFADPERRRNGADLHRSLLAFDRQAGYPLAWFFNMVATHTVPTWVAVAAIDDYGGGFRYLPERDIAVVRDWLHRPYAP
jgi:hypothetical protein